MPRLRPIRALRYATADGDVTTKIAPPYDVLDEGPKRALLERDPYNIVAIDLPVTPPKTVGPDEAYDGAAATLNGWLAAGVLKRDERPAVYAYEQVYETDGRTFRRRGLFSGLAVEEFNRARGGIFRHELTIKAGTDDRLKLMQATATQLSPIFGVFSDPKGEVVELLAAHYKREPDFAGTTDNDRVEHRCWIIDDEQTIAQLEAFFEPTDVFIADGHHRYTTALNYHQAHPDQPDAEACLFVLVAVEDEGMIVLPTHRAITGMTGFTMERLTQLIARRDDLLLHATEHGVDGLAELEASLPGAGPHAMGLYDPVTSGTFVLTAKDADPLAGVTPDKPEVWRTLDVAVLHELLIDRVLRPAFGGEAVGFKYTADLDELKFLAETEADRLAVVMQATPLASVCGVSQANEVMPPKSTYFFPKLATGLVINPLA